jgi:hypothetical protein
MTRQSTDKEGGREVVGRGSDEGRGMRHDVEKTHGRGGNLVSGKGMTGLKVPERAHHDLKMDHHHDGKGPFYGVAGKASTRREDGKY